LDSERDLTRIQPGDIVLLSGHDRREFLVVMQPGAQFQTHRGYINHDAIIGSLWGSVVKTHLDYAYMLLPPSLEQLIRGVQRTTQIVYPKDIGYLIMKMNLGPGSRVVEAGTGSGGLTLALARMVRPEGHIYTYESRLEMLEVARRNVTRLGLEPYVTFTQRDIAAGFDQHDADAVFLDVREPWDYLPQVHAALKGGGFFGALVPTTNQVTELLEGLAHNAFGFVQVDELLLRSYKAVAARLRPMDRMVAHTGYLIFARALLLEEPEAP